MFQVNLQYIVLHANITIPFLKTGNYKTVFHRSKKELHFLFKFKLILYGIIPIRNYTRNTKYTFIYKIRNENYIFSKIYNIYLKNITQLLNGH